MSEAEPEQQETDEDAPVAEPEPEAEPELEPEAPPEAQATEQGYSFEQAEKAAKASATDWKRYSERIKEKWSGYEQNLAECPLCTDDHKGFIDLTMAGRYPDELRRVIMEFLGLAQPIEYVQSQHTKTCTHCQGEGKVRSGSRVPEFAIRKCDDCNGFGFLPPPQGARNGAVIDPQSLAVDLPPAEDFERGDFDEFNQPQTLPDGRTNPNYGRRPAYWIPVEPWGNTVGLTAQDAVA
jgi:hypothetical protein